MLICPFQLICSSCDQYSQPYLSNPINREFVMKYISPQYYKYLFEEYEENILDFLYSPVDFSPDIFF